MNHLKPQFGVPVTVKFLKSGDVDDPPRLVRLEHPCGKSLNGMIKEKLEESSVDAGPGQMQGIQNFGTETCKNIAVLGVFFVSFYRSCDGRHL